MNEVRKYLSFGGGVNSTALMLLLLDQGQEFEAVYADHGADWPETREYVAMLQEKGYPVTVLETQSTGLPLYEYYWKNKAMPTRWMRHCTAKFKSRPLDEYMEQPCLCYIGISAEEAKRADKIVANKARNTTIEPVFPLVDENIDRDGCVAIIEARDLPVPRKSGCFMCPFQRVSQWKELAREHPDLFCKALQMEHRVNDREDRVGKPKLYFHDVPLEVIVQLDQTELPLDGYQSPPCNCGL